jgi:hypothetical protein
MIELPDCDLENLSGEERLDCCKCGTRYKHSEVAFDSGSAAPTVGETMTGATSGDTGVVVGTELYSGSYAGGDATGVVTLSTLTGVSKDGDTLIETVFQDNEELNGSTGGDSMMTVNGSPQVQKYGRLYAASDVTTFRGQRYCNAHALAVSRNILIDELLIDANESDRGEEW